MSMIDIRQRRHVIKTYVFVLVLILSIGGLLRADQAPALSEQDRARASEFNALSRRVVKHVLPAVVSIQVSKQVEPNPFMPQGSEVPGVGSGCIIDAKGYVITNNHVVENTDKIVVVLADGRRFEAQDKMMDPDTDLAIVKIDPKGQTLPVAEFGDSDKVQVGDTVMAMGSPFGFSQTVTSGIVSFKGRQTGILDHQWGYEDFIQTDADISKGNSGGPLVNLYGEVIGINSNILSPDTSGVSSGYGFSIPSNLAKFVSKQLIEHGTVKRGWLGIRMQSLSDLRKIPEKYRKEALKEFPDILKDIPQTLEGVLVVAVTEGDPADQAGMKAKDVILEVNGVKTADSKVLRNYIATLRPGTAAVCKVWRDGDELTLTVILGDREQAKAKDTSHDDEQIVQQMPSPYGGFEKPTLGIGVSEMNDKTAESHGYPSDTKGIYIEHVMPGSLAKKNGLKEGDVIIRADGYAVESTIELKKIISQADLDKGLRLDILNSDGQKEIIVKR